MPTPDKIVAKPSPCPACGTPREEGDAIEGHCPACLASMVNDLLTIPPPTADSEDGQWWEGGGSLEPPLISEWEIQHPLGQGGLGSVWRAKHKTSGKLAAIKVLTGPSAREPEIVARFEQEAATLRRLEHPNIVKIFEAGQTDDGKPCLIMEIIEGMDLRSYLRRKRPSPVEALGLFRQICGAIAHAHGRGVIHRDIKPANILISTDGVVHVADFGIARAVESLDSPIRFTQTTDSFGSPYYIAPETMQGAHHADVRSDIFSLGVVLHELLSGNVPLGNYRSVSEKVGLPTPLDGVIASALSEDPAKRPASVESLLAALDAALLNVKTEAASSVSASSKKAAISRSRSSIALITAGIVVLLGIGAFYYTKKPNLSKKLSNRDSEQQEVAIAPKPTSDVVSSTDSPRRGVLAATKERPFINNLDMRFVPIPGSNVLVSIWETRKRDFMAFERMNAEEKAEWRKETKRTREPEYDKVEKLTSEGWKREGALTDLGFMQMPNHPIVGVSAGQAQLFCLWLTWKERRLGILSTSQGYRLPTDEEWSLAAALPRPIATDGATEPIYSWGQTWPPPPEEGNFAGEELKYEASWPVGWPVLTYRDRFPFTAPVGSFQPNKLGLYDIQGNVAEWCMSRITTNSRLHVVRGGSWTDATPDRLSLTFRDVDYRKHAWTNRGFRCVIELEPKG